MSSFRVTRSRTHSLGMSTPCFLCSCTHNYRGADLGVSTFELRVQTDGSLTPRQAVLQACKDLVTDLGLLSREFTKEWELRKMVGDNVDGGTNGI